MILLCNIAASHTRLHQPALGREDTMLHFLLRYPFQRNWPLSVLLDQLRSTAIVMERRWHDFGVCCFVRLFLEIVMASIIV